MTIIGRNPGRNLPALSEPRHSPLAAPAADELALALQFARAEKSPSTRRAYRADFDAFRKWCGVRKLNALPADPATLATFLASEAKRGVKASTMLRYGKAVNAPIDLLIAGFSTPSRDIFGVSQTDICALGIRLWSNDTSKFVCNN
jgi:hypothetical protein